MSFDRNATDGSTKPKRRSVFLIDERRAPRNCPIFGHDVLNNDLLLPLGAGSFIG